MGYDQKYGQIHAERKFIPLDEPVFLFRGQDQLAPAIIREYAFRYVEATGDEDAAARIREQADRMEAWQPRKIPDA